MKRALLPALVLLYGACDQTMPQSVTGLLSYQITMVNPTADMLGSPGAPVDLSDVTLNVTAIDAQGNVWPQDLDVNVYVSFAGNKVGQFTDCGNSEDSIPLATVHLVKGVLTGKKLHLIKAYGVSTLWFESALPPPDAGIEANYATGTSPTIYFANPTIPDVQRPYDPNSPTSFYCSAFNGKHVTIDHASTFEGRAANEKLTKCTAGAPQATTDKECGAGHQCGVDPDQPASDPASYCLKHQVGRLVVTSVFISAYVVADTGANFHGSTGEGGYNSMYVFSFGRPDASIVPGRVMNSISGNIAKFVGFTEFNFPLQSVTDTVDTTLLPAPYVLQPGDRPAGASFNQRLDRLSAATVSLTGKMCHIDQTVKDWVKFNQFGLDMSGTGEYCDSTQTFQVALPGKTLGNFDPLQIQGANVSGMNKDRATLTVVGMLRNSSGQNEVSMPPILCHSQSDCDSAPGAGGSTCIEGSCKKGVYNFWNVNPRDISDIVVR